MAELAKDLNKLNNNSLFMGEHGINSIFWADDIVLLAESEQNLQELIDTVSTYCHENKLTINIKKTKCLTFNKTGRLLRHTFLLNGVKLENVREYKYLGFKFTPSGEISTGLHDLRDRALKAYYAIKNKLGESFRRNVMTSLSLFDSLISPILLYTSDFWGTRKLPSNNPIDNLQMRIFKEVLGVSKQSTNIGVLLELGRFPLNINARKLGIKNWERIRRGNANSILSASYNDSMATNLPWTQGIKGHLEGNGLLSLFINEYPEEHSFVYKKLHRTMTDQFHQNALSYIRSPDSKLRTYAIVKTYIGTERYLTDLKNTDLRIKYTKFSLPNHNLMIKKGRYTGLKKEERTCPFCPGIIYCPTYNSTRERLMWEVGQTNYFFQFLSREEKFRYLLTKVSCGVLADIIYKNFDLRDFLLSHPKRLE